MKKIGIVNYHYSNHNYGAVLQAAALHCYVTNELGYQSEHINFMPKRAKVKWKAKLKSHIKAILMDLGLKEQKITHDLFVNPEIFQEFRDKWLPTSAKTFHTFDELSQADLSYSHAIVGSDQVWRPSYTGNSSLVYFLAFLDAGVKKISYAASFGNDFWELNKEDTAKIATEIQSFDAISVREKSGVDICKNTFMVNAEHVLDPTLLVGRAFFDDIIGDKSEDYTADLVYYKLDVDSDFEAFINNAAAILNFTEKNIYYSSKGRSHYYRPVDSWLRNIKESKLVITDSFHCVCFAILFEVPFIYYPNDNRGLTRLESLLSLLELTHHIYRGDVDPVELTQELMKIDYAQVNTKLAELRGSSATFLADALA
ncbi:polysaccharide pyruvyl transferase family protein [Moritella sp.]|uniref:polysaccharide pyruvyl transferase family protein n=1 Tax=Moritella sp. TaxID=78556 RepID=UPI001DB3E097|nr:polysaccharide pyruvyl transferase family protein [Moritella sp.]MCJ8349713.1 polysaccharide pyruvyl transferase family protein [Moritella sp.]NQZ39886.1 polysaccharide pyruvyl transferase family protein [Moritella sp.]